MDTFLTKTDENIAPALPPNFVPSKTLTPEKKKSVVDAVAKTNTSMEDNMIPDMSDFECRLINLLSEPTKKALVTIAPPNTNPFTPTTIATLMNKLTSGSSTQKKPTNISSLTLSPSSAPSDFGALVFTHPNLQLITPRGRFSMAVHDKGLFFSNAKAETFSVPHDSVSNVVAFNKPDLYQKDPSKVKSKLMLLALSAATPVLFKNKALQQGICIQCEVKDTVDYGDGKCGPATEVLFEAVEGAVGKKAAWPNSALYKSQNGLNFVQCYNRVNEGFLFPMVEGLLFFKPPMYLPRSRLVSIACGRGGSGGQATQYVDAVVVVENEVGEGEETIEFTNIRRDELGNLNSYISDVLTPAMQKDADEDSSEEDAVKKEASDDDDDDRDEDFKVKVLKDEDGDNADCAPEEEVEVVVDAEEIIDCEEISDDDDCEMIDLVPTSPVKVRARSSRKAAAAAAEATRAQINEVADNEDDDDDEDDEEIFVVTKEMEEEAYAMPSESSDDDDFDDDDDGDGDGDDDGEDGSDSGGDDDDGEFEKPAKKMKMGVEKANC